MSRPLILALDVVLVWLCLGMATIGPVHTTLVDQCRPGLTRSAAYAHVAVWPVSVLATWGLRSRC